MTVPRNNGSKRRTMADTARLTREEVLAFEHRLSNWGRWGKDDEAGALNFITNEHRRNAAKLATEGVVVPLALPLPTQQPGAATTLHHMLQTGTDPNSRYSADFFAVAPHGAAVTHVDALCHIFIRDKMYNGFARQHVSSRGAERNGIEATVGRMVGRGVLLDIPAVRGLAKLPPGSAIYPEDLEEAERKQGVRVSTGDLLFIRTGRHYPDGQEGAQDGAGQSGLAGLHASCLPFLYEREVAVLASDGINDVTPSDIEGIMMPVHVMGMAVMGITFIDNCNLEALATTARSLGRWEFLAVVSPLLIPGGTGSPVTPLALF
jgi:kynurenine formamidase